MSEQQVGVAEQLAVINIKLDLLITQRDDHEARLRVLESNSEKSEDRQRRDERLTALERFQWKQAGAVAAITATAAAGLTRLFG